MILKTKVTELSKITRKIFTGLKVITNLKKKKEVWSMIMVLDSTRQQDKGAFLGDTVEIDVKTNHGRVDGLRKSVRNKRSKRKHHEAAA